MGCMAHILDLPGCFAFGNSRRGALQNLRTEIVNYFKWLIRHGEKVRIPRIIRLRVAETVTGPTPWISGSAAALFKPERATLTRATSARFFQLLRYSRQDLLCSLKKLPRQIYLWKPDAKTRSIKEILRHLSNCEWWYVSRLNIFIGSSLPVAEMQRLKTMRQLAFTHLRKLTPVQRSQVVIPRRYRTVDPNEAWTARKVLRRFLEHEREHTQNIADRIKEYQTTHDEF